MTQISKPSREKEIQKQKDDKMTLNKLKKQNRKIEKRETKKG